jgi:peptidoglycan-associated lipoprotein
MFNDSSEMVRQLKSTVLSTHFPTNFMSKRHLALISVASLMFLAACSSTKLDNNTSDLAGKPVGESNVAPVLADHLNPNSLISKERSVFFDYDQFVVKGQYQTLIERQAKYLAANPTLTVRLEGNADERGGREYNLALGQKRAEAVARALKVYGVSDKQAEPVSFGSEKPFAQGHDEQAWAQNRRVDFAYPTK